MKKIKNTVCWMLLLFFLFPILGVSVYAAEVITYTEVRFSATVPEEFEGDIIITLENSNTLDRNGVVLNADNDYFDATNVLGGNVYNTYVRFSNGENWKSDISEQYEIPNGNVAEFSINVTDGSPANNILTADTIEENESEENVEVTHSEDIDPFTNILKGEVAIQNFVNKISFIQNETAYDSFLDVYGWAAMQEDYLEHNTLNTPERWEKMSNFDRFVWRKACFVPTLYLFKSGSLEEYTDNATSVEKSKLELFDYPSESLIYDALVELCEWHYSYFQITGTVYDYYNNGVEYIYENETQDTTMKHEESINNEELQEFKNETDSEFPEKETEELDTEIEKKEPNKFLQLLKANIVTLLLLILVGIAFLVVKQKNLSANIYDETDR